MCRISFIRSRWAAAPSLWIRLKRIVPSAITSSIGRSSGNDSNHSSNSSSMSSKSGNRMSFFEAKYRKKVRREIPAAAAMSSTRVSSNPRAWNTSSAAFSMAIARGHHLSVERRAAASRHDVLF